MAVAGLGSSPLETRTPGRIWGLALVLAILWHLLFFFLHPDYTPISPPLQIEMKPMDPMELDSIRKHWRESDRQKQLLLNKDQNLPRDAAPPPDARYESDRNRRVEKEQRARQTDVIPMPKSRPGPREGADTPRHQPLERGRTAEPKLGDLGVPMRIGDPKPEQTPSQQLAQRGDARPPSSAADQAVLDKTVPEGAENVLNTQESVYYSFYSRIAEAVGPLWKSKLRESAPEQVLSGDYTTVVDVILDQNGRLVDIRPVESSGIPQFDRAVEITWRKLARFPNPPKGLLDQHGQVHIGYTFVVQMSEGSGLQFAPPRRIY